MPTREPTKFEKNFSAILDRAQKAKFNAIKKSSHARILEEARKAKPITRLMRSSYVS